MKIRRNSPVYGLDRYWQIINNGLFLFGLRNRLANIGFDIAPYYWVQEETEPCEMPEIKGNHSEYIIKYLTLKEFLEICPLKPGKELDKMIKGIKNGQQVIGLMHNNTIAAYTFVEFDRFDYKGRTFALREDEAYLLNMWTFNEYRGKNLAPYLRYQTYRLLEKRGIKRKYSITNYFNKSSIKFKNKLNAEHKRLHLSIVLFKRLQWNFTLRNY